MSETLAMTPKIRTFPKDLFDPEERDEVEHLLEWIFCQL